MPKRKRSLPHTCALLRCKKNHAPPTALRACSLPSTTPAGLQSRGVHAEALDAHPDGSIKPGLAGAAGRARRPPAVRPPAPAPPRPPCRFPSCAKFPHNHSFPPHQCALLRLPLHPPALGGSHPSPSAARWLGPRARRGPPPPRSPPQRDPGPAQPGPAAGHRSPRPEPPAPALRPAPPAPLPRRSGGAERRTARARGGPCAGAAFRRPARGGALRRRLPARHGGCWAEACAELESASPGEGVVCRVCGGRGCCSPPPPPQALLQLCHPGLPAAMAPSCPSAAQAVFLAVKKKILSCKMEREK